MVLFPLLDGGRIGLGSSHGPEEIHEIIVDAPMLHSGPLDNAHPDRFSIVRARTRDLPGAARPGHGRAQPGRAPRAGPGRAFILPRGVPIALA